MNKTDLLLQMMEQPHRYTADQWREILADDECRELYTLMSKTQSAIDATRADEEITDEIIDAEWQRFRSEKQEAKSKKHSFLKIAAMFAGVFFVSGITFAAIHIVRQYQEQETSQMVPPPSSNVCNCANPSMRKQQPTVTWGVTYARW